MDDTTQLEAQASPEEDQGQASPETQSTDPLAGKESLQKAALDIYRMCCADDRFPRLVEVRDVWQGERYWQGQQYGWWSKKDNRWNGNADAPGLDVFDADDMSRFEFVTNIYQSRGLMVIAAVAGAPPRVRFFPVDADDEKDLETAEGRTKLSRLIQRWNPPQQLLQEEAYHAWTGGFIAWWSRYVPNGEKYGYETAPSLGETSLEPEALLSCPKCGWSTPAQEAHLPVPCPHCGTILTSANVSEEDAIALPEDGEDQQLPKGRQVISVYGALNCKRPQHTNNQSQWHYFAVEEETHYCILRASAPDEASADKIKAGSSYNAGDDAFERNARLAVAENSGSQSQSGSSQASLVTHARFWLRPSAFWIAKDKADRAQLLELFPRGGFFDYAGDVYRSSKAESMDDAIVTTHAMPGRGQHRAAIGSSMISVQDRLNTFSNIAAETYEYGIPITYRDSTLFDSEANEDLRAAPGVDVEVALGQGEDIRSKIMQVRADSVSPDMHAHSMELFGPIADQISGAYPALSGAGEGAPDTVGQQTMQRDQAMGRMGIFYVNLKQAHAGLMTISCRCFEKYAEGIVKIPVFGQSGDFESETVDISALEGEAEAYPEGDENFPELWNQQRATMMKIMDTDYGKELAKDMGNAELFARMTGIPDLKIPGLDSWRKQLKEIAELTKIPGPNDDPTAAIAPMVEVDPVNDDNVIEEACCGWWLNSDMGQKKKLLYPTGWQAVSEHRAKHKAAIPKDTPPQKPVNETFTAAYKDLPPEAQAQVLAQMGINVQPKDFLIKAALDKAAKTPHQPLHDPNAAPPVPGNPMPPPTGASSLQVGPPVNAAGG